MPTVMPKDITMSKNKAKMIGEMAISDYEKKDKRVSLDVVIEQRMVDGNPKMYFCLKSYGTFSEKEEYTSISAFKKVVSDNIDYIAGELG